MASKPVTLAIQSQEGQKRVSLPDTSKTDELFTKVKDAFGLKSNQFSLYKKQNKTSEIASSRTTTVKAAGLSHGDRLFMFPKTQNLFENSSSSSEKDSKVPKNVIEDDLDQELAKIDGKIYQKGSQYPTDPFDAAYLQEQNIKFMSFHSYIKKLSAGMSKGKFTSLRNISCKKQPTPAGNERLCKFASLPSAITLARQSWRHVDAIVFENPQIVERFLGFWRQCGNQRGGWLYGRYEQYPEVPLGIKAVESSRDHLKLLSDPKEELVDEIAAQLGLRKVGWIFTDLVPLPGSGMVKSHRGADTHFLSAQEIITAAAHQNLNPNKCKLTDEGVFGSKFVTICVSGNKDNEVHMEGYQVSNQCMALVRDGILVPTKDAPELAYVVESTKEEYVPDVFFKEKDEYGNEITKIGRPLPVEYLLVDMPVSSPITPVSTFSVLKGDKKQFPVENRMLESSLQDFNSFAQYMNQFRSAEFLLAISDIHVLVFMAQNEIMPMREVLGPLYEAIKFKDENAAREWTYFEHWENMKALIHATTMN